jgi:large subunit ribosomal protein L30
MATSSKTGRPAGTLKIKMIGSVIGCVRAQRETVRGLGLRRLHQIVERADTPQIRGMVKKIPHLVTIVES